MKKLISLMLLTILVNVELHSQELSFYLSGGVAGKKFSFNNVDSKLDKGLNGGVGYLLKFSDNYGFLSGLEFGTFGDRIGFTEKPYENNSYIIDPKGSAFDYRVTVMKYNEHSRFTALSVPLQFHYRTNSRAPFYINGGIKVFMPLKQRVNIELKGVELSGFYPNYNILIDDLPQHGFGKIDELKAQAVNKLNLQVALSIGTGVIFKLDDKNRIYAGFYFDYGINDISKRVGNSGDLDNSIIPYSPEGIDNVKPRPMPMNSHVRILSYGFRLRYGFNYRSRRRNPTWRQGLMCN